MSTSVRNSAEADTAVAAAIAEAAAGGLFNGHKRSVPYAGMPSASMALAEARSRRSEVARGASPAPWAENRETSLPSARQTSPTRPDPDSLGMAFLAKGLTNDSATASLQRQFNHGIRARVVPPKPDTSQLTPQELNREAPPEGKKMFAKAPDQNPILLGLEPPRERKGMPYLSPREWEGRAGVSPRRSLPSPARSPREMPTSSAKDDTSSVVSSDARDVARAITDVARAVSREAPHRLSSQLASIIDPSREAGTPPGTPRRERSPRLDRARQLNLLSGHAMDAAIRGGSPQARLAGSPERRQTFSKEEELSTTVRESRRRSTPQTRTVYGLDQGLCQELTDDQMGISRKGRVSPKSDRQRGVAPWDIAVEARRGKMSLSPPRQAPLGDASIRAPFATDFQAPRERPPSINLKSPRDREILDLPRRALSPRVREKTHPFGTEADVPALSPRPPRTTRLGISSSPLMRDRETDAIAMMRADVAATLAGLEAAAGKVESVHTETGAVARAAVQRARIDLEEAMGTALRCLSPERAGPALTQRGTSARRGDSPRALEDRAPGSPRVLPERSPRAALEIMPSSTPPKLSPDTTPRSVLVASPRPAVQDKQARDMSARRASPDRRSSPARVDRRSSPAPPYGVDIPTSGDWDKEPLFTRVTRRPLFDPLPSARDPLPSPRKQRDISPTVPKKLPYQGRATSGSPTRQKQLGSPRLQWNLGNLEGATQTDKPPIKIRIAKPIESMPASSSKDRITDEDPLQQAYNKQLNALQSEIGQLQARHHGLEVRMKRLKSDTKRVMDKDPVAVAVVPFTTGSSSSKVPPPNAMGLRGSPGRRRPSESDDAFWFRPG